MISKLSKMYIYIVCNLLISFGGTGLWYKRTHDLYFQGKMSMFVKSYNGLSSSILDTLKLMDEVITNSKIKGVAVI